MGTMDLYTRKAGLFNHSSCSGKALHDGFNIR